MLTECGAVRKGATKCIVPLGTIWMKGVAAKFEGAKLAIQQKPTLEVSAKLQIPSLLLRVSAGNIFVPRGTI